MTMPALFECVPNFSEGRREDVLEAIRSAAAVPGVSVLGMEADPDHNRAVLTLVGPAQPLMEAAFRAVRVAVERIDLRAHQGTHPRIGAADVVPFVPWERAGMEEAIRLAWQFGQRVADALALPVYLYGEAARIPARRNLAHVRRGEFEGLAARMAQDPPDFGGAAPHPTAGAVAVGARRLLIAFNVYLTTTDVTIARRIAERVRGSSGGLVGVKALGMHLARQGRVQVSMNLVDYPTTPLPVALEMVRQEASRWGVGIQETEIVGFVPMACMEDVARYYLQMPKFQRGKILEVALASQEFDARDAEGDG
ncbi:MAG: glutamate formimidoyltransferase [Firmicutes bacterium]|nr:glutamate formimidoyltransferase [Bacillota bacterium]